MKFEEQNTITCCKSCKKPLLPNRNKVGVYCSHSCAKADAEFIKDSKDNLSLRALERKYKIHKTTLVKLLYELNIKPISKTRSIKTCICGNVIFRKDVNYCSTVCSRKYSESYKKGHEKRKKSPEERAAMKSYHSSKRRAAKRNAFTETANKKIIKLIYKHVPKGYQVDHIVPITKGGLHHENNLQYLPAKENARKKDRLDYEPQGVIRWQDVIQLTEE